MSDKVIHLAVDVGQSSTKFRLGGGVERRDLLGSGVTPDTPLQRQWTELIRAALSQLGTQVHTVAIGSTGAGRETAHDLLGSLAEFGVHRVVLAHDSVTSYLGALGDEQGCVIMAGTGTICLAVGPHDAARVDGWGHIIGDAGSAYWIGRTALEAAMRGYDGRRQLTALTRMMTEEFEDIELAYLDLQSSPERVSRIAAFAERVNELAASDRVAGNILDKAAAHLSEAVQAGLRRVQLVGPQTPRVAVLGGVFRSTRVVRRFTDYLTLQWPSFALTEPKGVGLDGAERLVDLSPGHLLYPRLSVAER